MDNKTLFVRTGKGEDEIRNRTAHLSGDIKRALLMVDGASSFEGISKRAAPSLRNTLGDMFVELEKGGFIQDKAKIANIPKLVVPPKMAAPLKKPAAEEGTGELDFTAAYRAPTPEVLAAEKLKAEAEAKAKEEAEARAKQEIEAAKLKAQQEAEAARLKAEQEAARVRAELEAAKAKAEAEAKARAQAEAKARQEAEIARSKAAAEAKARAEAEEKARREIEAARLQAQQEAEAARRKAEEEAARTREEAERARQQAAAEARAREEAERRVRQEAEAARVKAEQEAARARAELEAAKAKAEAEAKAREEAERRAQAEAEAARLKAQQEAEAARRKAEEEAARAREEAERARQQAAAEAKVREEAERRAREEAEAARAKAEQDAARMRTELETAQANAVAQARVHEEEKSRAQAEEKLRAEAEERARREAERIKEEERAREEALRQAQAEEERLEREQAASVAAQQQAEAALLQSAREAATAQPETPKPKAGAGTASRSTSATVLFLDVVGYTKQPVNKQLKVKKQFNQLLSECLEAVGEGERIILDTGDGAAVGFLQHPEDALEAAMQFRKTVLSNQHKDYPDLNVRIGIHLGPISIVKDVNGQSNMVGDGINDAQRVMSFAGSGQIYISRPYYDFVSRLSDEYADLFVYRGSQKDKHGREHQVYELVDGEMPAVEAVQLHAGEPAAEIKLEPFSLAMPEPVTVTPLEPHYEEPKERLEEDALMSDIGKLKQPVEEQRVAAEKLPQEESAPAKAEAAKPAVEKRIPTEEEVMALAATQAKTWAEAEQRAREAAMAKAERTAEPEETKRAAPPARVHRKALPWGKVGAGMFVVLLVTLFAIPSLLPMQDYAKRIEQQLSARVQQPVYIGKLSGRILPTPRLEMSDVSFGATKQIKAQQARVNLAFSALFSSIKQINSVELDGVEVDGAALQQVSGWLQQAVSDKQHPVARVELNSGKLETEGLAISGVGGAFDFDPSGKLVQAKLHAADGKYALGIGGAADGKFQVAINVRGAALPLLPNWVFDELNAKGELSSDGLLITDMDSRIMGGIVLGDARIDWRSGWSAQGKLVAKTITLQNLSKLLEGDMEGKARFRMQSASLEKLADTAILDGDFVVSKGVINGMDIVGTARLRSRSNLPGGRTHFDELGGELNYADGAYHFRKLTLRGGVLSATGAVDIAKREVSGRISADLAMRTGMGTVPLQLAGTTESLTLRAR